MKDSGMEKQKETTPATPPKQAPEKKKAAPRKKTIMEKYPSRQALVYSGAAFLILVTGMRTVLSVAEEGFGFIEIVTIGALLVEFSLLLLYGFTIYQAGAETFRITIEEEQKAAAEGKDPNAPPTKTVDVASQDMPEIAAEINKFTDKATALLGQLAQNSEENKALNARLGELADQQISIRVRQEIQRLLNANLESSK
jgi:hypothetical protein